MPAARSPGADRPHLWQSRRVSSDERVEQPRLAPQLTDLAAACGVATTFTDWQGETTSVPRSTVESVLTAMGLDVSTPAAVEASLAEVRLRAWRRVLPPVVVTREGRAHHVPVHVPHGDPVEVVVELEGGDGLAPLRQVDRWVDPVRVDGRLTGRATF